VEAATSAGVDPARGLLDGFIAETGLDLEPP
jgi:hypothetical protein